MTEDTKPSRAGGAFLLEREVGTVCGVSVEIWSSAATCTGSLVLLPTAEGFTLLVPDVAEDL